MWRRQIVWFSLSLALLSLSGWLTIRVTQVEGSAPFLMFLSHGKGRVHVSPEQSRLRQAQIFGVLEQAPVSNPDEAAVGADDYAVSYGTRKFGDVGAGGTKDAPIFWFF